MRLHLHTTPSPSIQNARTSVARRCTLLLSALYGAPAVAPSSAKTRLPPKVAAQYRDFFVQMCLRRLSTALVAASDSAAALLEAPSAASSQQQQAHNLSAFVALSDTQVPCQMS